MNNTANQVVNPVPSVIAITALVAAFAFSPANAATDNLVHARTTGASAIPALLADATPVAAKKASRAADKDADDDSAEARIKHLHDKFEITLAQEDTWNKVAAVIRENAEKVTALVKNRSENAKTMTAVDDLKSYAEIAGAHEDGTKKLIPAFKALYESMSDTQKQIADKEFREHGHHEHHGRHHSVS